MLPGWRKSLTVRLENASPRNANAFELQFETKTKTEVSSDTISFSGKAHNSDWFSITADGKMFDLSPVWYGQPGALTDTRVTLGMWVDWVRWTSRQAVSNYITPGTDVGNVVRTGAGFDDIATLQRIESRIWKTDSMGLSVFAEYARVGAYFEAPEFAIKRQDPFSIPNSSTTRLGGTIQRGPVSFTL
jgi:hypothetical protein